MGSFWDIVALSTVEIYGDFFLKFQAHAPRPRYDYLAHGIAGQAGVIQFLIRSLSNGETVMQVNGMWDGLSGLIESIAAYVFLGERLESALNYVGLLFVIVGIVLLKH